MIVKDSFPVSRSRPFLKSKLLPTGTNVALSHYPQQAFGKRLLRCYENTSFYAILYHNSFRRRNSLIVVPAFGFSAGDFIAVIGLIAKARKALRETGGAASQYQQKTFISVLQRVQALEPTSQNAAILQKFQLSSHICHGPLAHFSHEIRKFESPLSLFPAASTGSSTAKVSKLGRKVQWAVVVEDELAKLKTAITPQLALVDVLLQLESVKRLNALELKSQEILSQTTDLVAAAGNIMDYIVNRLVSKDQLAPLEPLLDGLSLQQSSQHQVTVDYLCSTQDAIHSIQSAVASQELLLRDALDQVKAVPDPAVARMRPRGHSSQITTSLLPPLEDPMPQCSVSGLSTTELLAQHCVQSLDILQLGIYELIVVFLFMMPAFHCFQRAFKVISRGPTFLLQDNIQLEDALGRIMSLPYDQFRHIPVLRSLLECEFKGCPWEGKVRKQEYHILISNFGTALTSKIDEQTVWICPGSKLLTSMRLKRCLQAQKMCPRCLRFASCVDLTGWTTW